MRFHLKSKIVLVLLLLSLLCVPVYGQTVEEDGQGENTGQTAVVARVEMPESGTDTENETEDRPVDTGDVNHIELYAILLLSSGVIVPLWVRK